MLILLTTGIFFLPQKKTDTDGKTDEFKLKPCYTALNQKYQYEHLISYFINREFIFNNFVYP